MGGAKIINTNKDTHSFYSGVFAGVKHKLADKASMSFGLEYIEFFGKKEDVDININFLVGPYVTLKYLLNNNLSLSFLVALYLYGHERLDNGKVTNTHYIFNNGSVGITYLF